jgi:environmental stress-induced protein Ves
MSWSLICANEVAPQAWRNGGGQTRELLAWPHPADWALRISVADIERDGPFSAFDGVQRWFGVLQGDGVRLADWELRAGDELISFDGGLAPACALIGGSTTDFNLMHRRGRGQVRVKPAASMPAGWLPSARWVGLFTVGGGRLLHGGRAMNLGAMSLAWCEDPAAQACSFEGLGAAWWMTWSENQT